MDILISKWMAMASRLVRVGEDSRRRVIVITEIMIMIMIIVMGRSDHVNSPTPRVALPPLPPPHRRRTAHRVLILDPRDRDVYPIQARLVVLHQQCLPE